MRIRYDRIALAVVVLFVVLFLFIGLVKKVAKVFKNDSSIGYVYADTNEVKLYDLNYKEKSKIIRGTELK